jgi:hypothetical protein
VEEGYFEKLEEQIVIVQLVDLVKERFGKLHLQMLMQLVSIFINVISIKI